MNFSIQAVYNWYRNLLRNPKYRWWAILGTLAYFVSPIDLLPDVFPVVGQIDDVFLITLLLSEVSQMVIEGVKTRKGNTDTTTSSTGDTTPNTAKTVDIDAVSVK
ncbi:MAG: DUF1232 domain-containing protein [Gloeocapsa sp. UFS-A4-WI-NPMV-4B04]|jgi:uncharacterized membrane protein YkvA (DUF1232 family)|nr:DUF1232 domain-containing protein [Gloeocapsa sp. UFS-A4-WI-NPMV-4B04]